MGVAAEATCCRPHAAVSDESTFCLQCWRDARPSHQLMRRPTLRAWLSVPPPTPPS
jgi:hypothetical protein